MDVSTGVKTDVKTTNGMIRPGTFRVIAGPCTVESYEQFASSAKAVKGAGFAYVPGGAFKPPHLSLLLPGPRRGGPEDTLGGLRRPRPQGRDRGHGPLRYRAGHGARGDTAD